MYARLTPKGKVVFGIIGLFILYLVFPRWLWWGGESESPESGSADYLTRSNSASPVASDQFHTLSDLLNLSPKVNGIALNYLSLPPLLNSNNQFPNYKNGGNMLLSRTSDHVRLVRDQPKQSGYLFSNIPISVDDLSAFEVELEFRIHGEQEKLGLIGDGMAIWLTTEPLQQGDVFGMQGAFNGLGVFLDTYKNYNSKRSRHSFPYLSLQRNRGFENYYDKGKDGIETQVGGCSLHRIYNNESDKPSKLRLTYVRQANVFEISSDITGHGDWRTCFRKENVQVDELFPVSRPLFLGVSAETGELHHNVDVYSIKAKSFRQDDGTFITEIDSLGEGIQVVDTESTFQKDNNAHDEDMNSGRGFARRRRGRKSAARLQRQERELKKKDKEKYGSEHGFVGWFFGLVWKFIKLVFLLVLILLSIYACIVGFRVYKEKQRKKNIGGLL